MQLGIASGVLLLWPMVQATHVESDAALKANVSFLKAFHLQHPRGLLSPSKLTTHDSFQIEIQFAPTSHNDQKMASVGLRGWFLEGGGVVPCEAAQSLNLKFLT